MPAANYHRSRATEASSNILPGSRESFDHCSRPWLLFRETTSISQWIMLPLFWARKNYPQLKMRLWCKKWGQSEILRSFWSIFIFAICSEAQERGNTINHCTRWWWHLGQRLCSFRWPHLLSFWSIGEFLRGTLEGRMQTRETTSASSSLRRRRRDQLTAAAQYTILPQKKKIN